MSEENDDQQVEQKPEFKPITSQEELDKLIGARINKVKSQFSDYDDMKAKAAKFDEVEQASKTELERERERAERAERDLQQARLESLRARVAADKGVPTSALVGSSQEELEKAADDLLAWRGEQAKSTPLGSLKSGSSGGDMAGLTAKERAAAALRASAN